VKLYCETRNIPTDNIRLSQNNIVDPENRYNQIFKIQVELPADISEKDRQGILRSIDRCTVKKGGADRAGVRDRGGGQPRRRCPGLLMPVSDSSTYIPGKDLPLEQTIANMSGILAGLGMKIEIASWRNIVPNVWSLHIRDAQSPMCFTNGKGATKEARWPRRWASSSSASTATSSTTTSSGAKTSPTRRSCITRTSAGSSRAARCAAGRDPRRALPGDLQPRRRAARLAPVRHQLRQHSAASARCRSCASRTARWCISRPT
jgi:hypothetical protein